MKKISEIPIAKLLLDAFNWFDMSLLASMKEQNFGDISHPQSMLMAHLTDSGIRISELAKCLRISRQAAQKRVVELEKLGFVYTDTDPTNLSAKIVTLTPKGRDSIKAALEIFAALEGELSKRIGVNEFKCMKKALGKDWGSPIVLKIRHNRLTGGL
ncbi:MAG TPA: MarR family transcriptional regulator [Gammaproteobacteria bacterium]|nr:MarR family transcriptional regulator [Gammaproteobacteria bacterium]